MKQKLQTLLFALVAIMMPIGASAIEFPEPVEITIGGSGVATLYYSSSSLEIPSGVTASIITGITMNDDGTVTVVKQNLDGVIPAGCAVILRGNAYTYSFDQTDNGSYPENNLLQGTDETTTDTEEGYLYFTLDSENEENSASLKDWIYVGNVVLNEAHKAYLKLSEAEYPELAEMLETLENPHLQHTHGGCEICDEITGVEAIQAAWGASADDLTEGTLEDAIFNAGIEDSNIGYIKLLADVESDVYVEGGNFTLDLNGYTISSESHTLYIQNNSNVTIVDNSETKSGKVISSGGGCFAVGITNASVTIEEGTYESTSHALNLEGNSSITINGGSYESPYRPVQIGEGCSATITGGTFTSKNNYAIYNDGTLNIAGGTFRSDVHHTLNTKGTLTIGGGEFFAGENYAVLEYSGGTIDLSEFDQGITAISVRNTSGNDIVPGEETILLPEGYCFYKGEKNVTELVYTQSYTIGEATAIAEAKWGTSADALTEKGTLDEAFAAAAEENSTVGYIQLQEDVENVNNINGGTFTLDLNGHTIGASDESHALEILGADTHVTLKGETEGSMVFENGEGSYAVYVAEGASVAIESGTYKGCYAIHNGSGCSVTIAGGEFEYTGGNAIDNFENLVVKGGTFTHDGESEGDESFPTIFYYSGSINLSNYPTDDINSIDVMNYSEEDITPGVETILLPEGYCFFDSEDIPVTVLVDGCTYYIGEEPAKYTITFIASDGEGEMEDVIVYEGDYTLPECTFGAPDGMMFDGWQVGDDEEKLYQPGDVITITADTEVTAGWGDIKIVINMYDSARDGWHGAYIEVLKDGESIGTATLEDGYDGRATFDYDSNCTYSFIWHYGPDNFYPHEISFEISIGEEQLFTSEEGDCEEYADGQQIYPVPTLDELSIADGSIEEFYYTKTIVGTLTYTRTLPNLVWNALYVPFEIPMSELTENYDVAYINDVHSYDNNEDGEIDDLKMEVIKITTGTLKANYPYLIRAKNEEAMEMSIVLTDATLYATKENTVTCSSVFMQFDVTGTYSQMSSEDLNGSLVITSDGSWKQLAESSVLRPFRLYLTMTAIDGSPVKVSEQAARSMRIVARGESEGTTSIDNGQWTTEDETVVYDLQGRRVAQPTKGMYIVNGRKVVIK